MTVANNFSIIPMDVWTHILRTFEPSQLTRLACVNSFFREIAHHNFLWEKFLARDFFYCRPSRDFSHLDLLIDPRKVQTLVLNFMEDYHVHFTEGGEQHPFFSWEPLIKRLKFRMNIGEKYEVKRFLKNDFPSLIKEPIPAEILQDTKMDSLCRFYIKTLSSLKESCFSKELLSYLSENSKELIEENFHVHVFPFYIDPFIDEDCEKGFSPVRRLPFIKITTPTDFKTLRIYYRILNLFWNKIEEPPKLPIDFKIDFKMEEVLSDPPPLLSYSRVESIKNLINSAISWIGRLSRKLFKILFP